MATFSEKLKYYRELSGLSLSQLEEATGIPKATLSRWENGTNKKDPINSISLIETALHLTPGTLIPISESDTDDSLSLNFTKKEKNIVFAYREQPAIQPAVDRLLGIEDSPLKMKDAKPIETGIAAEGGAKGIRSVTNPAQLADHLDQAEKENQ